MVFPPAWLSGSVRLACCPRPSSTKNNMALSHGPVEVRKSGVELLPEQQIREAVEAAGLPASCLRDPRDMARIRLQRQEHIDDLAPGEEK